MNLVPNKQLLLNVTFESSKYRKNELCGQQSKKRLLGMCNVQHVEMKSVLTSQPIELIVSTTVKSAKPAATF